MQNALRAKSSIFSNIGKCCTFYPLVEICNACSTLKSHAVKKKLEKKAKHV